MRMKKKGRKELETIKSKIHPKSIKFNNSVEDQSKEFIP